MEKAHKEASIATPKRGGVCQPSPKKQNQWDEHTHTHTHTHTYTFIFFFKGASSDKSLKSIKQDDRLEVQVRVDFAVLSPDSEGLQVGNSDWVLMLQS